MTTSDTIATAIKYLESGQRSRAKSLLLHLAERQPRQARVLELLGEIALEERQGALALRFLARAVDVEPEAVTFCKLAHAHSMLGNAGAAIDALREAVALRPDHAQAHSNLGVLLQARGQVSEAIRCFRRSVELEPLAETFNNLGCALKDVGEFSEAVECFERSLALKPDYPRTYSNLFFCLSSSRTSGYPSAF